MTWKTIYRAMWVVMVVGGVLLLGACPAGKESPEPPKQPSSNGPKKRVAVMSFAVNAPNVYGYRQTGLVAADMLTTALHKTGAFIVIERAQLDSILKEQGLSLSGFIDPSTAAQVGKVLGVQAIITGAVTEVGLETSTTNFGVGRMNKTTADVAIDVRMIDTTTAQLLLADNGEGQESSRGITVKGQGTQVSAERNRLIGKALRKAAKDVAKKIVAQR